MSQKKSNEPGAATRDADPIRIRHVMFAQKGLMLATPKDHYDMLAARESDDRPEGYDIYLLLDEDRFRFELYKGGRLELVKHMHVSQIGPYVEWEAPTALQLQSSPKSAA